MTEGSQRGGTTFTPLVSGRPRLVALSWLMLFVELALIRWLGSNVLYLSFFSNFVLLGSFLGIGLGFLRPDPSGHTFRWMLVLLALLIGTVLILPQAGVERSPGAAEIVVGGAQGGLPAWLILPVIFIAVAAVMATLASEVAAAFAGFKPLEAYRLDIAGSLLGTLSFAGLSFLSAPPLAWGVLVIVATLVLRLPRFDPLVIAAALAILAALGHEVIQPGTSWSPYYKIEVAQVPGISTSYDLWANRVPHQRLETLATMQAEHAPNLAIYDDITVPIRNVLIIGAGNGKDVAAALAHGATHVDAVEIDPTIATIGQTLNTDRPYQDPRVDLHITDGRAFLEQTSQHYDLILFAATDSITLLLGQSSLRLESYLFTQDSMETARRRLAPGGVVGAFNYYWQQWYVDRLSNTLQTVFGNAPCLHSLQQAGTIAALAVSSSPGSIHCATTAVVPADAPAPVRDDQPFPYLRTPSIPAMTLLTLLVILLGAAAAVRLRAGKLRSLLPYADLFLMGSAFLLLETKSVVQFALLFGTTWVVNAIVFVGILVAILIAIEVSSRWTISRAVLAPLLALALVVAWLVPVGTLLGLDFWPRVAVATALTFTPVLVANIVFAARFRDTAHSTLAFGANLLGAILGGLLEYSALLVGYRALLIVVFVLYAGALAFGWRWSALPG